MYMNGNGALCYDAKETTEKTCPVCSSSKIEDTEAEEHDGDEYTGYGFKCLACGAGGYRNYIRVFDGYTVTEIPSGPGSGIPRKVLEVVAQIIAERDSALSDLQLLNDGSDHAPCETCLYGKGSEPNGPDCEKCCFPKSLWVWHGVKNNAVGQTLMNFEKGGINHENT